MKRFLSGVLLFVAIFMLAGCSKNAKLNNIMVDEIFEQENRYFVLFYQSDDDDKDSVIAMAKVYYDYTVQEKYAKKRTLYVCNLSDSENSVIYRSKKVVDGGHGVDGGLGLFYVDNLMYWEDLYISSTPSLITVGTNSDGEKIATLQAIGYDDISTVLSNHLG